VNDGERINRRNFCAIASGALASVALSSACLRRRSNRPDDGRLKARPPANSKPAGNISRGELIKLGLYRERDAILLVPKSAPDSPLPLLLFLHGATQSADDMFWYLDTAPEETGVTILAPNSRETTWDAITDSFGADVQTLDRALERVFEMVPIDAARMAVGGFSDGATYAISLGLINGDLFKRVAAFSPGFVIDGATQGKPRFFISHGTRDRILPYEGSRSIASDLRERGYEVNFRQFEGGHEIPAEVMKEGLRWLVS
jgi:phospholipase/carboxylesterase